MKNNYNPPEASSTQKDRSDKDLRLLAQEQALKKQHFFQEIPEEMRKTIHELKMYRIELEMQNQELQKTELELYNTQLRYYDLYEMAPIGYLILSLKGLDP